MEVKIKATKDLAFKKVFSSTGNEHILAGLVEDFFGFEPKDISITSPYNIQRYYKMLKNGEYAELKFTLNDISARMSNGEFITEMQVRKQDTYSSRVLYYAFSRFCANYDKAGGKYKDLNPVYTLSILEESFFADDKATKVFRLYDDCVNIAMDREYLTVGFFELAKKEGFRNRHQEYWRKYFLGERLPDDAPGYIRRAEELIRIDNLSREEFEMLSPKEWYEADLHAYMDTAHNAGRVEGRTEGSKARESEIARNLKSEGTEKALIVKVTGLSEEEVDAL